jgi:hypothetical protein
MEGGAAEAVDLHQTAMKEELTTIANQDNFLVGKATLILYREKLTRRLVLNFQTRNGAKRSQFLVPTRQNHAIEIKRLK